MTHQSARSPKDRHAGVAAHRAHQSQWREQELEGWPPGPPTHPGARKRYTTIESCLAGEWNGKSAFEDGPNLMSSNAVAYTKHRLQQLCLTGGLAEQDRLYRNLLSSQPLAFSIAGELRAHPVAAARVISALAGMNVERIQTLADRTHALAGIDAEWAPPNKLHTGDRSGFDIAAFAGLASGDDLLITVEVKYIDTFSPMKVDYDRYQTHLTKLGLSRGAVDGLVAEGCSQFLRSVMLTDSVRRQGVRGEGPIGGALAVVLARSEDRKAQQVVESIANCNVPTRVDFWSHERFFDECEGQSELKDWARRMRRRYVIGSTQRIATDPD